jgi:DNA invertase Pin-like site-specific DNA recombinase
MTKKYTAYYRVSTKKQGESKLGLESQKTLDHLI